MALKVGTENKRNVIIAGVLFCIVVYLVISQLFSGPSTPPATTARIARTNRSTPAAPVAATTPATSNSSTSGATARKLPGSGLDPALHLERLRAVESIEYAGSGRNIFSGEATPLAIETAMGPARPQQPLEPVITGPPPPPQPPAIDLRYFGYSASKEGKREAFLLHGEDIFEAAAGEIVNHRYKVVAVDARSVQVTDLSYNNTQTLPLSGN